MTTDLGDLVPLAVYVADDLGTPVNATLVVVTVTLPDLTTSLPAVTNSVVGLYTASFTPTQVGRHTVRWVATGANACAYSTEFDVEPGNMRGIISLDEAKRALGIVSSNTTSDEELRGYVAAVTPIVEDITGPVLHATKTWTCDGGASSIVLPYRPTAVVSVVENGATLTPVSDYVVNLSSAIITRGQSFAAGRQNVTITYTVGSSVITEAVSKATAIIVKQMWQADRQGYRPTFGSPDNDTVQTPSGFLIPKRALELLRPTPNMAGFA